MSWCGHESFTKHGFDRHGRQRVRCRECGRTWIEPNGARGMVHRISPAKERLLASLLDCGLSDRQIMARSGCSHITINRRRQERKQVQLLDAPKVKGFDRCDYCGKRISGEREAYRTTARTNHKFCNHDCYGLYQRRLRSTDRCKRCKRMRKDIGVCVVFSHGLCPACYCLLRQFNFDEEAAALFELNKQLKKEISNGSKAKYQATHRVHRRPAENAH